MKAKTRILTGLGAFLLLLVLVIAGGSSNAHKPQNRIEAIQTEYGVQLDQGIFEGYQTMYEAGKNIGRTISEDELLMIAAATGNSYPDATPPCIRLLCSGLRSGNRGQASLMEGIDKHSLPEAQPKK